MQRNQYHVRILLNKKKVVFILYILQMLAKKGVYKPEKPTHFIQPITKPSKPVTGRTGGSKLKPMPKKPPVYQVLPIRKPKPMPVKQVPTTPPSRWLPPPKRTTVGWKTGYSTQPMSAKQYMKKGM